MRKNYQNEFDLSPEDRDFQQAMGALRPAAMMLGREEMLFRAGIVTGRRAALRWKAATAALLVACGVLSVMQVDQPNRKQIVHMKSPGPYRADTRSTSPQLTEPLPQQLPPPWPTSAAYLNLREQVLLRGVDALPESPVAPPAPLTVRDFVDAVNVRG